MLKAARSDLQVLMLKRYNGRAYEMRLAAMLAACNKPITEYSKNCKNKSLEMDLIVLLLAEVYAISSSQFRTGFTKSI